MAKDPAFLFYDGDAAKDVSHMNRLERGCYFDIIQQLRKFHGITKDQARKILGNDFETCWDAIELILEVDEDGKFFIPWVRKSSEDRQNFSIKQSQRIQKYWDEKKDPGNTLGNTVVLPKEDVIENENEITVKEKKKRKTGINHLFALSEFFDFIKFEAAFEGTDYEHCDLKIYYEKVKTWSASGGNKRVDWIATAKGFMLRDKHDNKLILKNGTKLNKTGSDSGITFDELAELRKRSKAS